MTDITHSRKHPVDQPPPAAVLSVALSPDGLEARLTLRTAEGGAPVGREAVLAALAAKGVTQGFLDDAIDDAVAGGSADARVVARGVPPQHGRDGWLESRIPEARDRKPVVNAQGQVDYRDLGGILIVRPGDALMLRHPPTPGSEGLTLAGAKIPAKAGKAAVFSANLPGTAMAADNPDLLQAAITGLPVLVRGGMMVEPVFKAEAVDAASGNIDFDGSVVILGDVAAGMTVRASGDIEIGGMVEGATLEAGGGITVKGGVIGSFGRDSGDVHYIRCSGSFTAAYAQQARIEAGDSIFIDDVAMQCELSAINHVRIGNNKRGHIVGGRVQATLSITAKVIGSPNRAHTECEIGVNPLMHKQLLELTKALDAKETHLLETGKLLAFAGKNPGKVRPEMLDKARATAAALNEDIAAILEQQQDLNLKISLSLQARVNAEQTLHEGVEVRMGSRRYRVTEEQGACAVGLEQETLKLLPLEKTA